MAKAEVKEAGQKRGPNKGQSYSKSRIFSNCFTPESIKKMAEQLLTDALNPESKPSDRNQASKIILDKIVVSADKMTEQDTEIMKIESAKQAGTLKEAIAKKLGLSQ